MTDGGRGGEDIPGTPEGVRTGSSPGLNTPILSNSLDGSDRRFKPKDTGVDDRNPPS